MCYRERAVGGCVSVRPCLQCAVEDKAAANECTQRNVQEIGILLSETVNEFCNSGGRRIVLDHNRKVMCFSEMGFQVEGSPSELQVTRKSELFVPSADEVRGRNSDADQART